MFDTLFMQLQLFAIECTQGGGFFDFPTWYKYLCAKGGDLEDSKTFMEAIPLVALGAIDILLRVAGIVAIGYVVFGSIKYVVSQGEPDKVSEAKGTIINALVGLVIASLAIAMVTFLGNRLG